MCTYKHVQLRKIVYFNNYTRANTTQHTLKHSVTTVCSLKSLRYVDKGSKLLTASEVQHIDLGDAKFL